MKRSIFGVFQADEIAGAVVLACIGVFIVALVNAGLLMAALGAIAIEAVQRLQHPAPVGAGLVMAAELSRALGYLGESEVARIRALVGRAGLPVAGPALGVERYFELMSVDKKARNGALRFIALERLGQACISDGTPRAAVVGAIEAATA